MSAQNRPMVLEKEGRTYIYDLLRKKYVVWTPEEAVRQQFIHYLINDLKYPKSLIAIEGGLRYNNRLKRTDIVVFGKEAKPYMLVECKRQEVKLGKEAIFQLSAYNKELDADLLVLTNGKEMICLEVDRQLNSLRSLSEIPPYK